MKKRPSSQSAFFSPRFLIALAFCSIGLLLALLAFALSPGGNALAQGPQQDQASNPERMADGLALTEQNATMGQTGAPSGTLDTKEILFPQGPGGEIELNNISGTT